MTEKNVYSQEPKGQKEFTANFDRVYSRFAKVYDWVARNLPLYRNWLEQVLPHLRGPRILEVSFGTGYLLTQYAGRFEVHAVDYNARMTRIAQKNLKRQRLSASLYRADVNDLPFEDDSFNCIVNTMAFSGYPDGARAMRELRRVLQLNGRLILLDINFPRDGNWLGTAQTRFWMKTGDLIRDMGRLFHEQGFSFQEGEVGGAGSVHLYIAEKQGA